MREVDPCRLADIGLAAAVRSSADAVYIEPGPNPDELFSLEAQAAVA